MVSRERTYRRAGMTLVELLVVVSILVLLSAAVLPNLAGRGGSRALQLAATNVSAQFAKSQSLAIARKASHGVWLEALPNNPAACIDLYFSEIPDAYRGDTFNARYLVAPAAPGMVTLTGTPGGCVASLASGAFGTFTNPGNLIQFNDTGPLFDFRAGSAGSGTASLRSTASQTTANSLWPAPPPATHRFAIFRLPTRAGQPLTLPAGVAIDLPWCGIAAQRTGISPLLGDAGWTPDPDYVAAAGMTSTPPVLPTLVAVFDGSGDFAEMLYIANSNAAATSRFFPSGPLLLLAGRIDRCGLPYNPTPTADNPGANWQYPDSRWIAIDSKTGIVKVAEPATGPGITTARASQALIRAGLTTGGM